MITVKVAFDKTKLFTNAQVYSKKRFFARLIEE